jgi:hypothetical protein
LTSCGSSRSTILPLLLVVGMLLRFRDGQEAGRKPL